MCRKFGAIHYSTASIYDFPTLVPVVRLLETRGLACRHDPDLPASWSRRPGPGNGQRRRWVGRIVGGQFAESAAGSGRMVSLQGYRVRKGRRRCTFRFYEELNEFLEPHCRKRDFEHRFDGTPTVKDRIESLGVPHTEVDLVLVDGRSVGFDHHLAGGEQISVYPVFERLDISGLTRLRPRPLRDPCFVLDVHLGRLAAYLRLLGFDCLFRDDLADGEIIDRSLDEHRIILTRDTGLLKDGRVTHGAYIYSTKPVGQVREVVDRFQLEHLLQPWTRCLKCNGGIEPVDPDSLDEDAVPAGIRARFDRFDRCRDCRRIYWPGSHFGRLRKRLAEVGIALPAAVD